MRIMEVIQHAANSGYIPFIAMAGERRSVKVSPSQIINALIIAVVTASVTSVSTVSALQSEMQNTKDLLKETRQEVAALRDMVYQMKTDQRKREVM